MKNHTISESPKILSKPELRKIIEKMKIINDPVEIRVMLQPERNFFQANKFTNVIHPIIITATKI